MPGGYMGYIGTLREICGFVANQFPSSQSLTSWIQVNFELSGRSANSRELFLRKAGVLESNTGQINLSEHASRWYVAKDDGILIALLHSRLQFFGEMLAEFARRASISRGAASGSQRLRLELGLAKIKYIDDEAGWSRPS